MSYIISSDLLDVDYRQKHIFDLLQRHLKSEPIFDSEVAKWGKKTLESGGWWYGVEKLSSEQWEHAIQNRQRQIIDLYESIKQRGYNGSTISIYFDKQTGEVHTYDGFHRLSIIKFLERSYNMNCVVSYHHPTREDMRGDFPLAERLKELNGGQEQLYQPCEDSRVSGWGVWRPDSEARLNALSGNLVDGSVLDVGCGSGWFSRQLARRGYQVTSLELNTKRLAVARYLSITQNLKIQFSGCRWQKLPPNYYDNILMLSVLHHDILARGALQMWRDLKTLRDRCKRLIVEFPLSAQSVAWLKPEQKTLWNYCIEEFMEKLVYATGMKVLSVTNVHPNRPIITLENKI